MKKLFLHKIEKLSLVIVLFLSVLGVTCSFAQNQKISDITNDKYALQNLEMGIQNINKGVRESAIYFAGLYRFIETEDALIKQLKVETESDLRILIGLALFRINSEKGMIELRQLISTDKSTRVRRMSYAIYNEYLDNNQRNKKNNLTNNNGNE